MDLHTQLATKWPQDRHEIEIHLAERCYCGDCGNPIARFQPVVMYATEETLARSKGLRFTCCLGCGFNRIAKLQARFEKVAAEATATAG